MIVDPDFLTHWKTQMLINELGDKSAPLYVIALWAHCQSRRSDTFSNLAPNALKAICRFEGEASKLRSALERCGFLDVNGEATVVHGWAETNAKLLANWTNGATGGRPRKTQPKPTENPPETQTGIGVTQPEPIEKRREDRIRLEEGAIAPFAPDGTSSGPKPAAEKIGWTPEGGFSGITDADRELWGKAYPAVNLERVIAAASDWLKRNPQKRKKAHGRFLSNWLAREQERGGDVRAHPAKIQRGYQETLELP